jgi:flagellar hook assembly protein FlgD
VLLTCRRGQRCRTDDQQFLRQRRRHRRSRGDGAGTQNFTWNGQGASGSALAAGNYTYTINATSAISGTTVTATPYCVVPVTSVGMGGQNGPTLDLGRRDVARGIERCSGSVLVN